MRASYIKTLYLVIMQCRAHIFGSVYIYFQTSFLGGQQENILAHVFSMHTYLPETVCKKLEQCPLNTVKYAEWNVNTVTLTSFI
jgi:hypothetical protein